MESVHCVPAVVPVIASKDEDAVAPQEDGARERVEWFRVEPRPNFKEMDLLKNLPSFNSENFSKFLSHGCSGRRSFVSFPVP